MSSFQVTTPNARLKDLKPGESLDVTYSVTNISGGARRGEFSVKTTKGAQSNGWYAIKGAPASDFAPGATQQVTVTITPSANATAQDCSFHLFVGLSGQQDVDFTEGPDVSYAVTPAQRHPFPWWIVAAAVVVLAIVGGVVYAVMPKSTTVPGDIVGESLLQVGNEMGALHVSVDRIKIACGSDTNGVTVTSSSPAPGQSLAPDADLNLTLSNCVTIWPHPRPLGPVIRGQILRSLPTP